MRAIDLLLGAVALALLMLFLIIASGCGAGTLGGQGIYIKADRHSRIDHVDIEIHDGGTDFAGELGGMRPSLQIPGKEKL